MFCWANCLCPVPRQDQPAHRGRGHIGFPDVSRVVQKEGLKANPRSFLLWHAIGANTGGQIGSVMAASVLLALLAGMGFLPTP